MYDWLKDYSSLTQKIGYLEYRYDREKRELGRWSGGGLGGRILHEKSIASGLEERIEAMEYELAHAMNDLYDAKKLISLFKGLDNQILFGKYVEEKTLGEVAVDLGYTVGHIYNRHAQIMKMIDFAHLIGQS